MKKALATITLALASATVFGQGRVQFNNVSVGDSTVAVSVSTTKPIAAGQGAAGANVGADYTAALLWAPQASYADEASFLAAVIGTSSSTAFFGATGGGPTSDGAGLFDGGTVAIPAGSYTMQVEAWYNPTGNTSFDQAAAQNSNVGRSQTFNLASTVFPATAPNTVFSAFTVQQVPEPSVLALSGLGAAALMLIRRKK